MPTLAEVIAEAKRLRDWAETPMATCLRDWGLYPPISEVGVEAGDQLPDKDTRRPMRRSWPSPRVYDSGQVGPEGQPILVRDYSIPRSLGDLEVVARSSAYRVGDMPPGRVAIRSHTASGQGRSTRQRHAFSVEIRAATSDHGRVLVWAVGGEAPRIAGRAIDRGGVGWQVLPAI